MIRYTHTHVPIHTFRKMELNLYDTLKNFWIPGPSYSSYLEVGPGHGYLLFNFLRSGFLNLLYIRLVWEILN